jgi:hypothetical protein
MKESMRNLAEKYSGGYEVWAKEKGEGPIGRGGSSMTNGTV